MSGSETSASRGQKECSFCLGASQSVVNKEHLISRPIAEAFGFDRKDIELLDVTVRRSGGVEIGKPRLLDQVSVRWVCESCNGGWMSTLEQQVGSWLGEWCRSPRRPMAELEAEQLRRWAVKTHQVFIAIAMGARRPLDQTTDPDCKVIANVSVSKALVDGVPVLEIPKVLVTVGRRRTDEPWGFNYAIGNPEIMPKGPAYANHRVASSTVLTLGPLEIWTTVTFLEPDLIHHPRDTTPPAAGLTFRRTSHVRGPRSSVGSVLVDFGRSSSLALIDAATELALDELRRTPA